MNYDSSWKILKIYMYIFFVISVWRLNYDEFQQNHENLQIIYSKNL